MTEVDISQRSVSTSYISFPETDASLQHSYHSLCDQEISWDCKSNISSYYSSPESLSQEEDAHVQSENPLLQQQSLQNYSVFVDDCIENSNSRKWQSDSPSTCSKISSKEESDLESMLEGRYESLEPLNEENSIAIQGQRLENKEDSECVEGDSFPLCYASFELLRYLHKISKQAQKI